MDNSLLPKFNNRREAVEALGDILLSATDGQKLSENCHENAEISTELRDNESIKKTHPLLLQGMRQMNIGAEERT